MALGTDLAVAGSVRESADEAEASQLAEGSAGQPSRRDAVEDDTGHLVSPCSADCSKHLQDPVLPCGEVCALLQPLGGQTAERLGHGKPEVMEKVIVMKET
jgi:hypothetical protein